jgi:hypothetical protein
MEGELKLRGYRTGVKNANSFAYRKFYSRCDKKIKLFQE